MAFIQCGHGYSTVEVWALFDIDWTLIRPEKGTLFTGYTAYRWLPGRLEIIKQLREKGYRIGLISNAKVWPQQKAEHVQNRLNQIYHDLGHQTLILAALQDDQYRKPNIGFLEIINPGEGSFYCGDAAGRPEDHSDVDIQFAKQAGLKFYYPEDIFPITNIPSEVYTTPKVFLILVGVQGSGKSWYAQQLEISGWIRISSDDYQSNKSRMQKAIQNGFLTGQSIVFDATNPTINGRQEYIQLGNNAGYSVAIVHLLNPGEARNKLRDKPVPAIALRTYWSRYEEPTLEVDHVPVYELL